jgi:hypothetical protein
MKLSALHMSALLESGVTVFGAAALVRHATVMQTLLVLQSHCRVGKALTRQTLLRLLSVSHDDLASILPAACVHCS